MADHRVRHAGKYFHVVTLDLAGPIPCLEGAIHAPAAKARGVALASAGAREPPDFALPGYSVVTSCSKMRAYPLTRSRDTSAGCLGTPRSRCGSDTQTGLSTDEAARNRARDIVPRGRVFCHRNLVLCQNSAQPASTKELCLSKSGETLAREQVTRRPPTLDCGSTHRWSGCVSFIIIIVGTLSISGGNRVWCK